ncbi:hypothetical protein PV328_002909 [Microctonus aethiopoides]|uniref:Exoribonuclease phosphorolytic domain-containing protein n=1 Tax=Microctonus aethiopoides TaxID=144406 RepID=A0AA39F7D4_9HYME|nr:hypothetical protein PV328_002909 [Microctonus aethiopoides]
MEECTLRSMNYELNNLSMPDGSSIFMQGDTCVVASVYGPIEAKLQKMMHDKANIEVVFTPLNGPPSINDRHKELIIKEACASSLLVTLHPGTAISINVQEMDDKGGLLACAINACCLALINSSLPMKYTIAAVNCMIHKDSNEIIIDPDRLQLENAKATFTYAFDSMNKDLICCHTTGRFTQNDYDKIQLY